MRWWKRRSAPEPTTPAVDPSAYAELVIELQDAQAALEQAELALRDHFGSHYCSRVV